MPPTTASWPCGARPRAWPGRRGCTETRNAQALFERDSAIAHAGRRLAALDIAKDRLLVGRLDLADGSCLYVGRLAVADEHGDPLVVDWRAPAAEPFYRALPHDPMGVVRRRHFRWRAWRAGRAGGRGLRRQRRGRGRAPPRGRGCAAGCARRAADRSHAGRGGHDPGRAGRRDPSPSRRRDGRPRGARHRQDGSGAPPGRVPALRRAGPPGRRGPLRRAVGDVPALRRGRRAVAR